MHNQPTNLLAFAFFELHIQRDQVERLWCRHGACGSYTAAGQRARHNTSAARLASQGTAAQSLATVVCA
jgi:hypothetical protein